MDRGAWTAKTVKRPRQQPAHPQNANYWAPLTRKRHTMPHSAQPQHTNYWAPRTRKRHQQEHRPQRPTESSPLTQHAKGRTGDCPGPRKGATTRRTVTQGGVFTEELLLSGSLRPIGHPPVGSPRHVWARTVAVLCLAHPGSTATNQGSLLVVDARCAVIGFGCPAGCWVWASGV